MSINQAIAALTINYRDVDGTIECVNELLKNHVDIIVIWDNSEDDGYSAALLSDVFKSEQRVLVRVSDSNLGFAAGINRGLEVCRNVNPDAWALIINNDALAPSNLACVLANRLAQDPRAVIVFPIVIHANKRREKETYYSPWLGAITDHKLIGSFQVPRGCCLMIATDRWQGPLFDEDFFMYGEEIELGWQLRNKMGSLILAEEVEVEHEGSRSAVVNSLFYESYINAAHLILVRKFFKNDRSSRIFTIWRLALLFVRAIVRSFRFRNVVPFRGLKEGRKIARQSCSSGRVHARGARE